MRGACRWTHWLYYLLPLTCGVAKCTGDGELTIVERTLSNRTLCSVLVRRGHAGQCACHPRSRVPRRTNALKSASSVSCRSMCRAVCLCVVYSVTCPVCGLRWGCILYKPRETRGPRRGPRLSLGSAVHPVAVLPFSVFLFVFRSVVSIPTRVRNSGTGRRASEGPYGILPAHSRSTLARRSPTPLGGDRADRSPGGRDTDDARATVPTLASSAKLRL